jgi:hypothetical protein
MAKTTTTRAPKQPAQVQEILNLMRKLDAKELSIIINKAEKYQAGKVAPQIKKLEAELQALKKLQK